VNRLDGSSEELFVKIMIPLQVALFTMLATSFCSKGGNNCKYSDEYAIEIVARYMNT
jgi:hypothetical protein